MAFVKGLEDVLSKFDRVEEAFRGWMREYVEKGTLKLHEEVKTFASIEDQHTLQVLKEMGHPYAVRHILPEPGGPQGPRMSQNPHTPPEYVHTQTGKLLAALEEPKINHAATRSTGTVAIDENQSPHARWVILGTSKMISRNFPVAALEKIRDDWWELLRLTGKDLVKNLKIRR